MHESIHVRRRRRNQHSHQFSAGFQLAPFIDVIFVLLLFYVVKVGVSRQEGALYTTIPSGGEVPPGLELQEEFVRIDADGMLYHNEESISPLELQRHMKELRLQTASNHLPLLVTVSTASVARYSDVVTALNMMNKAGIKAVTFQSIDEDP